jgi:hypothetical protein
VAGSTLEERHRAAPVSIDQYDWRIRTPLCEGVTYQLDVGITAHNLRDGQARGPSNWRRSVATSIWWMFEAAENAVDALLEHWAAA